MCTCSMVHVYDSRIRDGRVRVDVARATSIELEWRRSDHRRRKQTKTSMLIIAVHTYMYMY